MNTKIWAADDKFDLVPYDIIRMGNCYQADGGFYLFEQFRGKIKTNNWSSLDPTNQHAFQFKLQQTDQ